MPSPLPRNVAAFALLILTQCDCAAETTEMPEAPETPVETAVPTALAGWENIDFPAPAGALGLDLSPSSDGLIATWVEPEAHRVRFSRFTGEWSAPTTVVEDESLVANWADFPRSAEGGDGALYVNAMFEAGASPYAYEVRLFRALPTTDSDTFAPLGLLHQDGTETEHGFVSMTATDDGVQVYWLDGRGNVEEGGTTAVYSTRAVGDGPNARVAPATPVDPRVCDCCQTDAAATADGPMVAYRDREDGEIRDISVVQGIPTEDQALPSRIVHRDGWEMPGCPVNGPAIAASEERSAVAWFSGAEGGAVYVAFRDADGEFGPRIVVDGAQPPGRVDITLLEGGAAVSWLSRRDADSDSEPGGVVRVRFVSEQGVVAPAVNVGNMDTGRAGGFPIMEPMGEHLYVGYRDANEQLQVKRMPVEELPRGAAPEGDEDISAPLELGAPIPASAALLDADEERIPLEALITAASADEPLVVALFARWCQPCRQELAALEALRVAHPNWTIIAISIDEGSGARAEAVARDWGFQGSVLRDAGAAAALRVPPLPGAFAWNHTGLAFVSGGEVFQSASLEAALAE